MRYLKVVPFLILLVLLCGCESNSSIYPGPGRDTVDIFGDWRFEIVKNGNEETRSYCLYDKMEGREGAIEDNILNYIEIAPCVYVIGTTGYNTFHDIEDSGYKTEVTEGEETEEIEELKEEHLQRFKNSRPGETDASDQSEKIYYTKVNYETGEIQQETELSAFSEEDIAIFEELSESESPFENK